MRDGAVLGLWAAVLIEQGAPCQMLDLREPLHLTPQTRAVLCGSRGGGHTLSAGLGVSLPPLSLSCPPPCLQLSTGRCGWNPRPETVGLEGVAPSQLPPDTRRPPGHRLVAEGQRPQCVVGGRGLSGHACGRCRGVSEGSRGRGLALSAVRGRSEG